MAEISVDMVTGANKLLRNHGLTFKWVAWTYHDVDGSKADKGEAIHCVRLHHEVAGKWVPYPHSGARTKWSVYNLRTLTDRTDGMVRDYEQIHGRKEDS